MICFSPISLFILECVYENSCNLNISKSVRAVYFVPFCLYVIPAVASWHVAFLPPPFPSNARSPPPLSLFPVLSESCMPAPSSTTDILTLFSSLRVFIVIQLSGMLNFSAFISRFDSTVWHFCLSSHISSISVSICNFMDIPFSLASSVKSLTISAIHPSNLHLCTFNLL